MLPYNELGGFAVFTQVYILNAMCSGIHESEKLTLAALNCRWTWTF